jgi:hypothetical protein
MFHHFDYTAIATVLYIFIVAVAFAPKCPHVSPDSPVEYFPEIEAVEKSHLVNLPVRGYESSFVNSQNPTAIAPKTSLHGLSIRELKKLASTRKIKRYGSLNKQQLIFALT